MFLKFMININAKLAKDLFGPNIQQAPIRNGYGDGLLIAGEENQNVVALCADLTESTKTLAFKNKFPNRFVELGVAEQNMAAVASGMAAMGKIPFLASYAMFSPGRNWEQIRTTICYNQQNVKIAGAHAGISVGPDGGTHQAVEDMSIMRVIPNMVVIAPCDAIEAKKATIAAARYNGPVYIRFAREKTPVFTTEETPFEIGKAVICWQDINPQVTIIVCGSIAYNGLMAAHELEKEGIQSIVINCPTIKPLDKETIIDAVKQTKCVVTVEEHQIIGGLGSAVSELLSQNYPVHQEFIGVRDRFGESGEPNELVEKFGMGIESIIQAVRQVISRVHSAS